MQILILLPLTSDAANYVEQAQKIQWKWSEDVQEETKVFNLEKKAADSTL